VYVDVCGCVCGLPVWRNTLHYAHSQPTVSIRVLPVQKVYLESSFTFKCSFDVNKANSTRRLTAYLEK